VPKKGGLQVRRVRSADDRKIAGDFFQLDKIGKWFMGYALFVPDPEADDNPGYYEYFEHYMPKDGYVPCAGPEDCIYCKANHRPSTRAKTVWLVVESKDDGELEVPEKRIFNFNWNMINEFSDFVSEDEVILGRMFRIKRMDDRGNYSVRFKDDKLKKAELKEALEDMPDLDNIVTGQLLRKMEEADVEDAMEDDEDEPKSRRGIASKKAKADEEEDDEPKGKKSKKEEPDTIEDETFEIVKVSKKQGTITVERNEEEVLMYGVGDNDVSGYSKGDTVKIDAHLDDDEDWIIDSITEISGEAEAGELTDSDDLPDEIEEEEFEVVDVNAQQETITLTNGEITFDLYFLDKGPAADVDFDDYSEGMTVVVSAVKDNEGDMVAKDHVPKKKKGGKK
jgi:hypothetical protein